VWQKFRCGPGAHDQIDWHNHVAFTMIYEGLLYTDDEILGVNCCG